MQGAWVEKGHKASRQESLGEMKSTCLKPSLCLSYIAAEGVKTMCQLARKLRSCHRTFLFAARCCFLPSTIGGTVRIGESACLPVRSRGPSSVLPRRKGIQRLRAPIVETGKVGEVANLQVISMTKADVADIPTSHCTHFHAHSYSIDHRDATSRSVCSCSVPLFAIVTEHSAYCVMR